MKTNINNRLLAILCLICAIQINVLAQGLYDGFQNPPKEARPRVWWHWMDANITLDGIRKDIAWMDRAGIGGFHLFDAGMGMKPVVAKRLVYMSPEWKEAYRLATSLADSLGMEVAIASCPGWSNTGGPWVKPEQAMKRLVWREVRVKGGKKLNITLPEPEKNLDWYRDAYVIAVRLQKDDKSMVDMGAKRTAEAGKWVQYELSKSETIRALSIADGSRRSEWAAEPAPVTKHLEASIDGRTYKKVCDIPHGGTERQTIEIPPTKGRFFRVVYDTPWQREPELTLYTVSKINHAEEKAGFATPSDLMANPTTKGEGTALKDVIDLTAKMDANGRLTWEAPKGNWKILRFGYTLTGKQNHPASKEATGLEVTKLDKAAFTSFLTTYLDMYKQTGSMPQYLLIDSYEAGWETWAPQMAQTFEQRRGYSLLPWLPVLTGELIESAEKSEQFLFDWRTTIGELIVDCMYENAARIAKQYGMGTYFEAHENGRLYLPDGMAVKCRADIPMAAMWTQLPGLKVTNSSTSMAESDIRESASVAHLYGKRLVAAESLTANGMNGGAYSYYPGNLKPTADLEMANGVNRFVIHESTHQPLDSLRPGLGLLIYGQWFNRHETWAEQARAWTDYLARSSYMLQQGQNVADILWYYGEDDCITSLYAHEHPQVPYCYNFDYLNKEALLNLITFDGERLVTPSGATYRLLVIDKSVIHTSEAVSQKLLTLRQQGAMICDLREASLSEALAKLTPDFTASDGSDLRYVHRTTAEGDIYWINNRRDEARRLEATFRVSGLKPMVWHPETGRQEAVRYEVKANATTVQLDLVAHDAVFIVFTKNDTPVVQTKSRTLLRPIDTPWTVNFDEAWGGPKEIVMNKLTSWTEADDVGLKYYSGTAVYHNSIAISETELKQGGRFVLDLGQVGCMAEVLVNGQPIGTAWKAPYTLDMTEALEAGQNAIEIRVVNQWVNRIIGDMQPDCKHKYTYTPAPFYKADARLLPAGLIGPVAIFNELTTFKD